MNNSKKSNMMDSVLEQHTMRLNQTKFAEDSPSDQ